MSFISAEPLITMVVALGSFSGHVMPLSRIDAMGDF